MTKRLLVTFDSPVAIRGSSSPVSPDGGLVLVDAVPVSPAILPIASSPVGSVARALLPRHGQSSFSQDSGLLSYLADNPALLEGFNAVMNGRSVSNDTAVSLYQLDERVSATTGRVTFWEALHALFSNTKQSVSVVNCCFGVDLRCPSHRDQIRHHNFTRECAGRTGVNRLYNYAAPDYMLSPVVQAHCGELLRAKYDALIFRAQYLQTLVQESLMTEQLSKFYSLRELAEANVSLDDLLDPRDLAAITRLLERKSQTGYQTGPRVRIVSGDSAKFQVSNTVVPADLQKSKIVVLAVATGDEPNESLLQRPCAPAEFETYSFDPQDKDVYVAHVVFNLQRPESSVFQTMEKTAAAVGLKREPSPSAPSVASNARTSRSSRTAGAGSHAASPRTAVTASRVARPRKPLDQLQILKLFPEIMGHPTPAAAAAAAAATEPKTPDIAKLISSIRDVTAPNLPEPAGSACVIFREFLSRYREAASEEFEDLFPQSPKGKRRVPSLDELLDSPVLMSLFQQAWTQETGEETPGAALLTPDAGRVIRALIKLIRGLNGVLYETTHFAPSRALLQAQAGPYPSLHAIWACTQPYGYGMIQEALSPKKKTLKEVIQASVVLKCDAALGAHVPAAPWLLSDEPPAKKDLFTPVQETGPQKIVPLAPYKPRRLYLRKTDEEPQEVQKEAAKPEPQKEPEQVPPPQPAPQPIQHPVHAPVQQPTPQSDLTQDTLRPYYAAMLEAAQCERLRYYGEFFELLIPKALLENRTKPPKSLVDFIQGLDRPPASLGLDPELLGLLADLQGNMSQFQPGLLFDKHTKTFYYLPLVLNPQAGSVSRALGVDLFRQAQLMQSLLVQQQMLPPSGLCQANILTILNQEILPKKFLASLKEHMERAATCQQFLGHLGTQLLEAQKFEPLLKRLLGVPPSDPASIVLNVFDEASSAEREKELVEMPPCAEILDSDDAPYAFALANRSVLAAIGAKMASNIPVVHQKYLQGAPQCPEAAVNSLKDFVLTQHKTYPPGLQAVRELFDLQLSSSSLQNAAIPTPFYALSKTAPFTMNALSTQDKQPLTARNIIFLGRLRGLMLARALLVGAVSPDAPQVQCKKQHGFVSLQDTLTAFERLNASRAEKTGGLGASNTDATAAVVSNAVFPAALLHTYSQLPAKGTQIMAPAFKRFGPAQKTGMAELRDVFGRELRSRSPYQPVFYNMVSNEPSPLEVEQPPAPAASGEEQTMQHLIDLWEVVRNRFFSLGDERLRALRSPLYCLEQREIEVLEVQSETSTQVAKDDKRDGAESNPRGCVCGESCFVLHPSSGQQLDQFQRGIYYMSPYFVPQSPGVEVERDKQFALLAKYCASQVSVLLKEQLNHIVSLPSSTGADGPERFLDYAVAWFSKRWPKNHNARHLREISSSSRAFEQHSTRSYQSPHKSGQGAILTNWAVQEQPPQTALACPTMIVRQIQKYVAHDGKTLDAFGQYLDRQLQAVGFWPAYDGLEEIITLIVARHPCLNLLGYGDPADLDIAAPTLAIEYLSVNKVGVNTQADSMMLQRLARQIEEKADEVLTELLQKQQELRVLEQENLRENARLYSILQKQKIQDIQNEKAELFCTAVNAAWGRLCQQDRAPGYQKLSQDQLALGGFETNGPRGDYAPFAELREIAREEGIAFGCTEWTSEGFDIRDIVDFD